MRIAKQLWQRWLDRAPSPRPEDLQPPHGVVADELCFRAPADVVERRLGEDLFLVHFARGSVHRLNRTAVAVWELAGQRLTAEEIAEHLHAAWAVPREQLRQDVRALLAELLSQGLVEPLPKESP